jgi:DNA-binding XRE family transcriptional regulator
MTGQFLDCLHKTDRSIAAMSVEPRGGGAVTRVQKFREAALMAKAELARKAGVSESTIDRVEAGHECRMETKRKILFALGLSLQESQKLWPRVNGRARR